MNKFSIVGIYRMIIAGFYICTISSFSNAQAIKKEQDRSGLEISSILQSEIRVLKYEDSCISYEISRKIKGSKKFNVVSVDKKTNERTPHVVSSTNVLAILNGFSVIRSKNKVDSSHLQTLLGKIELADFSDLEPQEYIFYKTNDGKIVLRLYENESYVVDLPLSLFNKAKILTGRKR